MLKIFSKRKNYPYVAIAIALIVSFVFTMIVPHEWASTPQAQSYISIISVYVPAMAKLRCILPPDSRYMALTGAAIWGLMPIYLLLALLAPYLDEAFLLDAKKSAKILCLSNKKSLWAFAGLIAVDLVIAVAAFFTVWESAQHYGLGSWMNMLSPNVLTQIITWVFMGLFEFLFISLSVNIFWIVGYKIYGGK